MSLVAFFLLIYQTDRLSSVDGIVALITIAFFSIEAFALVLGKSLGLLHDKDDKKEAESACDTKQQPYVAFQRCDERWCTDANDQGPCPVNDCIDGSGLIVANL